MFYLVGIYNRCLSMNNLKLASNRYELFDIIEDIKRSSVSTYYTNMTLEQYIQRAYTFRVIEFAAPGEKGKVIRGNRLLKIFRGEDESVIMEIE
jgi:hypothetical protein